MQIHLCQKILNAEQTRQADQFTIRNEPIASIDLMERASKAFTQWFISNYSKHYRIAIFCGTGNNGGDGLAIARILNNLNYQVEIFCIGDVNSGSRDFRVNLDYIQDYLTPTFISKEEDFPLLSKEDITIDAIFGSGLSRPATGLFGLLIDHINASPCKTRIAVDIASGLSCDQHLEGGSIMEVSHTITFQAPKLAHLLPQNESFTGELKIIDIGLDIEYIKSLSSKYYFLSPELIHSIYKKRKKFSHKGTAGHSLLMVGSIGKMGAAVLSSRACLRAGTGLLTVHAPKSGLNILQTSVPEAMVVVDHGDQYLSNLQPIGTYSAIGVGPGIGIESQTAIVVNKLLKQVKCPLVIDADAINILASHPEWLDLLPPDCILTPHPGEFKKLVGEWGNDYERLQKQIAFCEQYRVILVLKGAHTSICDSDGSVVFNNTGNPGMATGGSGDVLTGVITALLSQGYEPLESAIMGVYIHGMSGDLYANKVSQESLIASDLIEHMGDAIRAVAKG